MRIAIAQMNSTTGDFEGNVAKCLDIADKAAQGGAEFVVFPQAALCGGSGENIVRSESFARHALAALRIFARRCPIPAFIGSVAKLPDSPLEGEDERSVGESIKEAIFYCDQGKIVPIADSSRPDGYMVFGYLLMHCGFSVMPPSAFDDDMRHLDACIVFDDCPYCEFADGSDDGMLPASYEHMLRFAVEEGIWLLYCNMLGGMDSRVFPGACCVISPSGGIQACEAFKESILICDICDSVPSNRFASSKSKLLDDICASYLDARREEADAAYKAGYTPGTAALYGALVLAVKDYFAKNRLGDCLIGISGGMDSALVAAIACDALGAEHVHGLLMPGPYSSEGSISDALALAENFGFDTQTISICPAFESLKGILDGPCGGVDGIVMENLQARIRMLYLMTLSNKKGWIVLNTSNKSEAAMGFSTLYGDTAGAISPLGDVYKSTVFQLARWRNRELEMIPESIINKPPSAELHEGQLDEDRLPPYEILDAILELHIDEALDAADIVAQGFEPELVQSVLKSVRNAEFKRRQEPFAPIVSAYSFEERAWPISNRFFDSVLPDLQ